MRTDNPNNHFLWAWQVSSTIHSFVNIIPLNSPLFENISPLLSQKMSRLELRLPTYCTNPLLLIMSMTHQNEHQRSLNFTLYNQRSPFVQQNMSRFELNLPTYCTNPLLLLKSALNTSCYSTNKD